MAAVDEKERKNGNDPEKELVDSGFHDYRRPSVALYSLVFWPSYEYSLKNSNLQSFKY